MANQSTAFRFRILWPQGDAEQEPQPSHDAVADAHAGLGQVQLKPPDIVGSSPYEGTD
jgi:hypothetical protein